MKPNLLKPLVVFDLETTGLDLVSDRIIQISFIKIYPDWKEERENIFINPERPIPSSVVALTGISDADVADAPTFKQKAKELADKFSGCDFAGFNSNRNHPPFSYHNRTYMRRQDYGVPSYDRYSVHQSTYT